MLKITIIVWMSVLMLASQITAIGQNISMRLPVQEARFQQAIEYYNSQEYNNAIPIFEEIINDSCVFNSRSQLIVYASMWLSNAFVKSGHIDKAYKYSYLTGLYCGSQPINPDDFLVIDSISLVGRYNYEDDLLALSIEQFKKRQKLLEETIGKNHLWTNGGRSILIDLYQKYITRLNLKSTEYDVTRTIAYTDTIANLGYEIFDCLNKNFAERPENQAIYVYYQELMSLLEELCKVSFINNYYEINYTLLNEIDRLINANPVILTIFEDHWFRWASIHYTMRWQDQADGAPKNKYNIDEMKFGKIAEQSYLKFLDKISNDHSDFHKNYRALSGLKDVYNFLSMKAKDEMDNDKIVSDFKYDFYKIEKASDSITLSEYQKVNNHGIDNFISDVFVKHIDDFTLDCSYEDLKLYDKKYIDVWKQIIDLLKNNDLEELLNQCTQPTPYELRQLTKEDLTLFLELLQDCEVHSEIDNILYYKMIVLRKIVKCYKELSSPLWDPLWSQFKSTSSNEEMMEYLEKYVYYYKLYILNYKASIANIEKSGKIYFNTINQDYFENEHDFALLLFYLAERANRTEFYLQALHALESVVKNEFYDSYFHGFDKYINICKIKLENSDGYIGFNSKLKDEFNSLLTTFKYATMVQRTSMWDSFMTRLNEYIAFSLLHIEDSEAAILAYNSLLYKKGILLTSDKNFIDVLNSSQITESTFVKKREKFNQLISNGQNIDSLAIVERQLQDYLRDINYNNNLVCDWTDIQKVLSKNELTIEFGVLNSIGKENLFAALILPNKEKPILIDFGEMVFKGPLDMEPVRIIQKKLQPYLQLFSTIYFSPDGFLYNIPLEHLIEDDKAWIRLTSTRYLINNHHTVFSQNTIRNIALFGGLDYDYGLQNVETINTAITVEKRDLPNRLRNGAANLPFTYVEVNVIDSIAKNHKICSNIYSGLNGTESNFRSLIQQRNDIEILHFATHGFYWTESEVRRSGNLSFIFAKDKSEQTYDEAMNRSGLLLSGANCSLKGYLGDDLQSDGILTSKEISLLNLHGLDMAVLSACQTGLGEITSDGVFGLQRGFKKAGANSLLVSLWKVDDHATQLLMSKFYEYLFSGDNNVNNADRINGALKNAQKYVREYVREKKVKVNSNLTPEQERRMKRSGKKIEERFKIIKERPYKNPIYWAGFILLDALH